MMITFLNIIDIDRFFQVIDACNDSISFKTSESRYVDIRHNNLIKEMLEMSCCRYGIERLELYVKCSDDLMRLMRYMMDCHCKSSICNQ